MSSCRLLVSVLGTSPKDLVYELCGRTHEARLAPIALLALDDEPFDKVIALCTSEAARESLPLLERGADGVEVRRVDVPNGVSPEEIGTFLDAFTASIPARSTLVVDITHGFRHLSFLILLGALYAATLGRTEVQSVWYAHHDQRLEPTKPSPFVDLSPLLELTGFLYAVRVLRTRGDPQPLADELGRLSSEPGRTQGLVRALASMSHAYASALPLELGRHAGLFLRDQLKPLKQELRSRRLPLVDELLSQVSESLKQVELPIARGQGWKRRTSLDVQELARQADLIDELLERGSLGPALTLMEEWVISWVCLRLGLASRWLDRAARAEAANKLHALMTIDTCTGGVVLSAEQRQLAQFWGALSQTRNAYAHAGMRGDEVENALGKNVHSGWKTLKRAPDWSLGVTARGTAPVLVSAVGTTPGPLYSALRACSTDPSSVIAICSHETRSHAEEALRRAESTATLIALTMIDPVGGTSEIDHVVSDATHHVLEGPEVLVNLTGGTTLMGLAVERIACEARRLGRPVRRFGLIDRRTREQQLADPFQAAEPYWLDPRGDEGTEDNQ
ncbi:MAG: CRISPR-associated DxTHG motif protein [Thermoleophilia bacterium]|nr:CRISPR-associated DxTHG motif protein [Thermoleophilia bacterium]